MDDRRVRDARWAIALPEIVRPVVEADSADPDCASTPVPVVSSPARWMPPAFFSELGVALEAVPAEELPRVGTLRHGLAYEAILAAACRQSATVELLAHNLTIPAPDGSTLGQADFLLRWRGEVWHLETAVKFYLRMAGPGRLDGYIGAGGRDQLDEKLAHMLFHQRTVLARTEAAQVLADARLPEPDHACVSIRGVVFEPVDRYGSAPRFWWAAWEDARADGSPPAGLEGLLWTRVGPAAWFSPLHTDEAAWQTWDALRIADLLADGSRSVCLAARRPGSDWEHTRGFMLRRRA